MIIIIIALELGSNAFPHVNDDDVFYFVQSMCASQQTEPNVTTHQGL
jgi:hypothetical protein